MTYSSSLLAAHERLSTTNRLFLEHTITHPAWQRRDELAELQGAVPTPVQPWPTFIGRTMRNELERASCGVFDLVRAIPKRAFGGDVARFARHFGAAQPANFVGLMDDQRYLGSMIGRGDFILSPGGPKCLEVNVSAALGGWDTVFLLPRLLGNRHFQRFQEETGVQVSITNSIAAMFDHLLRRLLAEGLPLGLGISTPAFDSDPDPYRAYLSYEYMLAQERAGVSGGSVWVGLTPDFRLDEETTTWHGPNGRLGVLLEYTFPPPNDPRAAAALRAGTTIVLNGPLSSALGDKRCLALLSEHALSGLTDEERAIIDAYVPWTRVLRDEEARFGDATVRLPELVATAKDRFVLKRGHDFGGHGVLVGRDSGHEEWSKTVREALASGDWVLQELVTSEPLVYQHGSEGSCEHDTVWGVFLNGSSYSGVSLRVVPRGGRTVINVAQGAEKSIVLETED